MVTSSGAYTVTTSYSGTVSGISRPVTITVLTTPSKPTVKWDSNLGMVSSADTGNQWYTETMTAIPGATGPGYKPSGPGFFYLRVTQNGCSSPFSDRYQYVITATVNLGGPDKYLRVAPNPVTSLLYINFNYPGITTLMAELTDLRGNQLLTEPDLRNGDKMDLSGMARGVYFLKLFSQNGRISVMTPILKL